MRILVTGASGFLGGHVVERLLRDGHSVRILLRRASEVSWLASADRIIGDLKCAADVERAAEGCDAVAHCAAVSGYQVRPEDWSLVNVEGTRNVVEACQKLGVGRLVHISTFLVTAKPEHALIDEAMAYEAPGTSEYVDSKIAAEQIVAAAQGLATVILRPGVIYGPRDRAGLPRIIDPIKSGRFWFSLGGRNPCHLIYVENLVDAIVAALTREEAQGAYFILDQPPVTVSEFIAELANILGAPRPTRTVPLSLVKLINRVGYRLPRRWRPANPAWRYGMQIFTRDLHYSTRKAQRELGFRSGVGFQEAIARLAAWLRSEGL
jgi:nucleoside-diphosphate-sugar epimerase